MNIETAGLEQRLGYTFAEPALLRQALTHASATVGQRWQSNERLEFLGDSVLQLILTEALEKLYKDDPEGKLTAKRATLVRGVMLAMLAAELSLSASLKVGGSEVQDKVRALASTQENALEAVIGAIFLDGGFAQARDCVLRWYGPLEERLARYSPELNPKGVLQELVQPKHGNFALEYRLLGRTGKDHELEFSVGLYFLGEKVSESTGSSKKLAEEMAARVGLRSVQEKLASAG